MRVSRGDVLFLSNQQWAIVVWKIAICAMTEKGYTHKWLIHKGKFMIVLDVVSFGSNYAAFVYTESGKGWINLSDLTKFTKVSDG